MGSIPDPKALRLLKNDKAHAHRFVGIEEPEPSSERARPPERMSERAIEIFEEFVKRVEELYPCSQTDAYAISLYANNQEQLESYELELRLEGSTVKVCNLEGDIVSIKIHPLLGALEKCKALSLSILKEFGLTASARKKINIKPAAKKDENPFAALD